MIDWPALPVATRSDLERAGVEVLLCVAGRNPTTGEAVVETMRVPLSVLREWLNREGQ